jgi:hypothetical protein
VAGDKLLRLRAQGSADSFQQATSEAVRRASRAEAGFGRPAHREAVH